MHRRGVFHGDMKPQNIMLSKNGQVKLIDFGTAMCAARTRTGARDAPVHGSEQATEKTVDAKTDIYNFGRDDVSDVHGPFRQQGIPKPGDGREAGHCPAKSTQDLRGPLSELIIPACRPPRSGGRRACSRFAISSSRSPSRWAGGSDLKGADEEE